MSSIAQAAWKTIVTKMESIFIPRGFDLVIPMTVGMYNDVAPEDYKIPITPQSLLVMIGNTKHLWPIFVQSIDLDSIPAHPLNEYAEREITSALKELEESTSNGTPEKIYWVHDTEPGKMIAAIRMVVASQFASFSQEAHLSVHPKFGPWFGLRAAVVFACDGPTEPVYNEPTILELPASISQQTTDLYNRAISLSGVTDEAKSIWFELRTGIMPNHPFMYSDAQVRFHYANTPELRAKILRSVRDHVPFDYLLDEPLARVTECRELFQQVLRDVALKHPDAILLSGGLDTSIIAEARGVPLSELRLDGTIPPIIEVKGGITVKAHESARDAVYANAICKRIGIKHHCLDSSIESLLEHTSDCAKLLCTFDPMELRNSIVIYRSLLCAKEQGYSCVVTGDGADELFAGYSFYHSMEPERMRDYRDHIARIMRFSSSTLAKEMNIEVLSPFLDPRVVEYAIGLGKTELVGAKSPVPNGKLHGKLILRQAFPEAYSQWRDKEPIEQGAGTTQLRMGYFDSRVEDFEEKQRAMYLEHDVVLRDKEHLYFFEQFLSAFSGSLKNVPKDRYTDDACPSCYFQLSSPAQDFCVTCGFWPARTTEANAQSASKAITALNELVSRIKGATTCSS